MVSSVGTVVEVRIVEHLYDLRRNFFRTRWRKCGVSVRWSGPHGREGLLAILEQLPTSDVVAVPQEELQILC